MSARKATGTKATCCEHLQNVLLAAIHVSQNQIQTQLHNITQKNHRWPNRDFSCFTVCHICEKIHYFNVEGHHNAIATTSFSERWDWSSQSSTAQDSSLLACDTVTLGM